ncbi:MAG: ABC transporter permease [Agathobacter sp.]|nr:ABC transporter permease [Agathobacter sp.]
MKSDLFTIIKKEFARFFGDKRMVFTALMPGLLIYALYSFMGDGMSQMYEPDENYVYEINVVNMPQSLAFLEEVEEVNISKIQEADADAVKDAIREDEADILVVFPENFDAEMLAYDVMTATTPAPNVEIYYNSANTESSGAYSIMREVLNSFEQSIANKFDICQGEKEYDLATEEDISAMVISMMMPMLILMMLFSGCLSVSAESIAGEKERGTIATLLVTPMKRRDLALGKMISLSTFGLLSGLSSFIGIMLSLPNLMGGSGLENVKFGYSVADYAVLLLVIITTTLLIVGMISIISAYAKSVKEASTMASPLMIIVSLVGVTNMMSSGMPEELYWYLIPIYNSVQCISGVFSMDYQMLPVIITCVANTLYSGIFVVVLTKMFGSERIMYT